MKPLGMFVVAVVFAGMVPPVAASDDNWKKEIESKLEAEYPLAERKNVDRITKPGITLVVKQPGITANVATDFRLLAIEIDVRNLDADGKTAGVGLFQDNKRNALQFKEGEKVYPVRYSIKDDEVHMQVMSVDTYQVQKEGNTQNTRYTVLFRFKFPEGERVEGNYEVVKAAIQHYFATEDEAAAGSVQTIALGQSREQVEKILGMPSQIFDLGSKVTYVYPDMKVIFIDGKVADVQ